MAPSLELIDDPTNPAALKHLHVRAMVPPRESGTRMTDRARLLALYLPQFHPIPENDRWWGPGFTEWTNTAKAKPLFPGHYQPHVPADLGFYDLRLAESRQDQANMARKFGIEGFCYYHYWFSGRRILERPFQEVLASGEPDFPFCLCWANETWSGIWHGNPKQVLVEQTYPGEDDHRAHVASLLPAFRDPRYICVDGRPMFLFYRPEKLPAPRETLALWRSLATEAGLPGLHLVGMSATPSWDPQAHGFDAKVLLPLVEGHAWISRRRPMAWLRQRLDFARGRPKLHDYQDLMHRQVPAADLPTNSYPCLVHAWDNTPRSSHRGVVFTGTRPDLFGEQIRSALTAVQSRPASQRFIVLKAWNEWAEGNHLEPDLRYGTQYLEVIRNEIDRLEQNAPGLAG